MVLDGRGDVRKPDLHLGRNAHAVEILLPIALCDLVVDENNEPKIERLSPANDYLTVDESIIDAVQLDRHQPSPWAQSDVRPFSAACRAASAGVSSPRKTNSSSVARLVPVTRITPSVSRMIRRTAIVALPAGRSVKKTLTPSDSDRVRSLDSMSSPLSPEFDNATKTLPYPVICSTALIIPSGNDP